MDGLALMLARSEPVKQELRAVALAHLADPTRTTFPVCYWACHREGLFAVVFRERKYRHESRPGVRLVCADHVYALNSAVEIRVGTVELTSEEIRTALNSAIAERLLLRSPA